MLLLFSVGNHRSIRESFHFSMIASRLQDDSSGLITTDALPNHEVLPAAVIYGANASGKSNFIDALRRMRFLVLNSHSRGRPEGGVPRDPFRLDPTFGKKPTEAMITFIMEGMRYEYGFHTDGASILSEWLYAFPKRKQILFERRAQNFEFGRSLRGRNQTIAALTRKNSLFLSAAAQNDHHDLTKIYTYFSDIEIHSLSIEDPGVFGGKAEIDERSISFLKEIGTGVVGYRKEEVEVPETTQELQKGIFELLKRNSDTDLGEVDLEIVTKHEKIELGHLASDGSTVFFDLGLESSGTRRMLFLLQSLYRALDKGGLVFVDELDASLHTQACEAALALFSTPEINTRGAQLVVTTHDTNLLNSPLMRRDQVWFCEKGTSGETLLFPLSDISVRKTDNLERGYLQGRFGATPYVGSAMSFVRRSSL